MTTTTKAHRQTGRRTVVPALNQLKRGDTFAECLAAGPSVAGALESHAGVLRQDADTLAAIAEALAGLPAGAVSGEGDTHHLALRVPDDVAAQLVAAGLVYLVEEDQGADATDAGPGFPDGRSGIPDDL